MSLIKLTTDNGKPILIGTESIISVEEVTITNQGKPIGQVTQVRARAAMVDTFYVNESVEEIYQLSIKTL